jgi:hypothetical protein
MRQTTIRAIIAAGAAAVLMEGNDTICAGPGDDTVYGDPRASEDDRYQPSGGIPSTADRQRRRHRRQWMPPRP